MNRPGASVRPAKFHQTWWHTLLCGCLALASAKGGEAQGNNYERSFPQSKTTLEKVLKELQPFMSGHLPVLDGFAMPAEHPLDHYQRAYFQAAAQVSSTASGGSLVRVSAKITAWYSDSMAARSGYQLLKSNGRIEADLLDQLTDQLAMRAQAARSTSPTSDSTAPPGKPPHTSEPTISPPTPRLPDTGTFSSSLTQSLAAQEAAAVETAQKPSDKDSSALQIEAQNLEEILKNQTHPQNLVAVKKSGTPIVATPSLNAKPLFLASRHDEFEMLDFNQDWVHIRISGLSRGWVWRTSVEMPDGIPDTAMKAGTPPAADLFHVTREETAPFPGDWAPLRGKSVKIVSVEKTDEKEKESDPQMKLEFAKFLFDKSYSEIAEKARDLAGIVLIFDSADGGMIAATVPSLRQWKAGTLSDSALWHQCFFDPPETFSPSGPSGS